MAANWSFNPLALSFPQTVFPNVALWNATNDFGLTYQIQVSWPLEWENQAVNNTALTLYNSPLGTLPPLFH